MALDGLRVAARTLRKQPVFTTVVVLSLAIGIALNTTMYGVLDAMMKPRIDMRAPERLYWVRFFGDYKFRVDNRARDAAVASGMHTYDAITPVALSFGGQLIEHDQNARDAMVAAVGANFFDVTGTRPLLGRTFIPSDENAETKPVVVSDQLVSTLFRPGESPIGARVTLNREARIIVGVVPSTANFPHEHYWAWDVVPVNPRSMYIRLIRLRDGATAADADRELQVVANRIALAAGEGPRSVAFRFHAAADPEFQVRGFEIALILAVAAVMLVACANLANIQLARGLGRRRELALRSALGATRGRVITHLLSESVVLGTAGLVIGLVLTYWGSRALTAAIPRQVGGFIVEPQLSWRVLVFAIGATLVCIVAVGLLPAISVSRTDPNELLKSGAGTGATKRNRRTYGLLVTAEIALALVLSTGAAALVRTWMLANSFGYGFDTSAITVGDVSLRLPRGPVPFSELLQTVIGRLGSVRGASEIGASMGGLDLENRALSVDDGGSLREFASPRYSASVVSPSYLHALGLTIVAGRDFLSGERDHASIVVDEQTAAVLWPNGHPIGALVKLGDRRSNRPYVRVVGVVANLERRRDGWIDRARRSTVQQLGRIYYLPGSSDLFTVFQATSIQVVARAKAHPEQLPLSMRQEIAGWPDAIRSQVSSWDDYMGLTQARESRRFVASLFCLFAILGVALAAFGVYGVIAHSVAERRREFGVRVALGATSRDILRAVLRENVVVALAGTALGLLMTKYGVQQVGGTGAEGGPFGAAIFDVALFTSVAALLIAIVAISALIPALRATRIDPTESLRHE